MAKIPDFVYNGFGMIGVIGLRRPNFVEIGKALVDVQPLAGPAGLIYYHKMRYKEDDMAILKGFPPANTINPTIHIPITKEERVANLIAQAEKYIGKTIYHTDGMQCSTLEQVGSSGGEIWYRLGWPGQKPTWESASLWQLDRPSDHQQMQTRVLEAKKRIGDIVVNYNIDRSATLVDAGIYEGVLRYIIKAKGQFEWVNGKDWLFFTSKKDESSKSMMHHIKEDEMSMPSESELKGRHVQYDTLGVEPLDRFPGETHWMTAARKLKSALYGIFCGS
jgi:hypothetical protein